MSDERETRRKLRQAARFEVYARLVEMSDMYRGQAESEWRDGNLDNAVRLRRMARSICIAASDIRDEFDIERHA